MEVSKERKKFNDRWTVTEVLGVLSIITLVGGFVQHTVKGTEDRVLSAIEKTDTKIDRVEGKIDEHVQFHLRLPYKCYSEEEEEVKEVSYAESNKEQSRETVKTKKRKKMGEGFR